MRSSPPPSLRFSFPFVRVEIRLEIPGMLPSHFMQINKLYVLNWHSLSLALSERHCKEVDISEPSQLPLQSPTLNNPLL